MDTNVFYGETAQDAEKAKAVCGGCLVVAECLAYGLREEHGVWGGTTPRMRMALRARLRREARKRELLDAC
jgi:WhiB family redox-sensing transcriptional regulator